MKKIYALTAAALLCWATIAAAQQRRSPIRRPPISGRNYSPTRNVGRRSPQRGRPVTRGPIRSRALSPVSAPSSTYFEKTIYSKNFRSAYPRPAFDPRAPYQSGWRGDSAYRRNYYSGYPYNTDVYGVGGSNRQ